MIRRPALPPRRLLGALAIGCATALGSSTAAVAVPPTPRLPRAIDAYASYQPQRTCSEYAKPGVVSFRALVMRAYPGSQDWGILRACSDGGTSEHKEGRAWDWHMPSAAKASELLSWLLATDHWGHRNARARRIGIMYVIYNGRIWGAYRASEGWRPYSCSGTTGCHRDHVHFSFSWDGARKRTSWWDGTPVLHAGTGLQPGTAGVPQPAD